MRTVAALLVAVGLVAAACGSTDDGVDLARGERLFGSTCAACHGTVGQGTFQGPPLVHVIYEPGHHPDEAFQRAVAQGVAPHHWSFGPMAPVPGLSREEVADITAHVRELQRAAGIID
jgi:mono/diheme cytochrome c family protein